MMRFSIRLGALSALLSTVHLVAANVEKAIFLGPALINIPTHKPTLPDLNLLSLTPGNHSIRTELDRVFPSDTPDQLASGHATWLLLDNLTESQRYEVRVCWAATEPTSFDLDVFELATVWETPDLIQSLAEYASSRRPSSSSSEDQEPRIHQAVSDETGERSSSALLLRVLAAADYFTDNAGLMVDPPPVLVDLILDPFIYNVLPRSLVPTVGYIVVVAMCTWFVARWTASYLGSIARSQDSGKKHQ